jgi:hypothetical protein
MQPSKCKNSAKKGVPSNHMRSKELLKYLIILALLMFSLSAIPAAAQEGGEGGEGTEEVTEPGGGEAVEPVQEEPPVQDTVTDESGDEAGDEASEEEVVEEEAVKEEVTEDPVETSDEVAEPAEDVAEPTGEEVIEPVEEVVEPVVEPAEVVVADDVDTAASLPGNFTSQIIAVANLNATGAQEAANLNLDEINGSKTGSASSNVFPGGVNFIRDTNLTENGSFSGILSSNFPAAAAVFTVNSVARTADAYPGLSGNLLAPTLYATRIFNKHANFESTLICQNAGGGPTNILFELFRDGDTTPRATVTKANVAAGESVLVDMADDTAVQAAWPGGQGQLGFAKFSNSANVNIACIIDSQRMAQPHVQTQFNAVPTALAGTELYMPLVFHGHGVSSANQKGLKFNTGISIVNVSPTPANVRVQFTTTSGFQITCSTSIPVNGGTNWYTPEVPAAGWTCDKAMQWSYPGPSIGAVKLTSDPGQNVIALANSNRYDPNASNLGAGYSSVASAPSAATSQVVCPLAFNKNAANDWVTGVRVVNLNTTGNVNVTFRMIRAGGDPSVATNVASIPRTGIAPGASDNVYFPETAGALANFEGAVFITAGNTTDKIAATSSSTNYTGLGSAALYDCLNY